jgi:transketolase
VLSEPQGKCDLILIASGSEVSLIVGAQTELAKENIFVRLVSMPSWELFEEQSAEYKASVLPKDMRLRLAVEAGVSQGWERYVGDQGEIIGIDHFGASAPGGLLMKEYGFSIDNVVRRAKELLAKK